MSSKNHTLWGWRYLYPYKGVPLFILGQRYVLQINTFRSVLMCRKLELMYSSSFSHWIGSVLYLAWTTNLRLWQQSESHSSALAQTPSPRDFSCIFANLQPFSDWMSFRKRNTISFWEIASCSFSPSKSIINSFALVNFLSFCWAFCRAAKKSYNFLFSYQFYTSGCMSSFRWYISFNILCLHLFK